MRKGSPKFPLILCHQNLSESCYLRRGSVFSGLAPLALSFQFPFRAQGGTAQVFFAVTDRGEGINHWEFYERPPVRVSPFTLDSTAI
jgi:hypothetical protein